MHILESKRKSLTERFFFLKNSQLGTIGNNWTKEGRI